MKKSIKFALVGALLLALVLMLGSCNLSDIPEELVGMIPDEIKNLHEHPWDEWAMVYGEGDVSLVCNVCKATVKTQPFSEGLDIRDGVLYGIGTCTDKEIVVPYGVTEVANDAFQGASIKGILLPDTLKTIGNDAFKNCQSMAVIHFPNGLEFIGERAFQNCKALVAIVLPNSVKTLGAHSFENCQLLGAIYYYGVEEDWEKVEKGKDWNKGAGKHAVTYKGVVIAPDGPNPDHESQGLAFELNEDGQSYSVVGIGTCTDTDVVIPSKYKGLPVTAIKEGAFSECLQMHSIYIPDSVTRVEVAAFIACSSLESVRFSTNTKVIDMYAFFGSGIIELNLPNDVETIDEFAFSQCYSLKKVSIGTGLKNAGWGMFYENTSIEEVYIASDVPVGIFGRQVNLKKVTVAEGVSSIGDSAFQQCYALESVTLPSSLKHIGKLAFSDCDSLTQISIPSGIESVGVNAFGGCNALEFNEYKNALYLGNPESPYVVLMKIKSPDITSCEIADSCRVIYQIAFWACNKIESHIIIPEGVVSIGMGAFCGCSSPKIYIPSTVVHIVEGNDQGGDLGPIFRFAFAASPAYFEIHPDNQHYKSIDGCIFSKDTKTMFRYAKSNDSNEYVIPEGVERIVCFALEMATGTITVPKTVKYIEEEAFSSNITTIIYNGTVEEWNSINKYSNWRQMNTVVTIICTNGTISEGKEINTHDHSFGDWTVTKQPSETETGLKERVCSVCGKIESEEIPIIEYKPDGSQGLEYELNADGQSYSVVGIGTCTDTDLVIPSIHEGLPVTNVGAYAFKECSTITSVIIPDSIVTIDKYAFQYCASLTNIKIPSSVTQISNYFLRNCPGLLSIDVDTENQHYKSIDGHLYTEYGTVLMKYAQGKADSIFTVPNGVTRIDRAAFQDCVNLTKVVLPDGLLVIDELAFLGSYSLTEINLPISLTTLNRSAFNGCSSLKKIDIPAGVTSIGYAAFYSCSSLTTIVIPDGIAMLDRSTFTKCESLISISIPKSVISLGNWIMQGCSSLKEIKFNGSIEQWQAITKGTAWDEGTPNYTIYCTDGTIAKDGTVTYYVNGSQGLEYELNADGQSYSVVGIGTCTDTDVVIPSEYNGLPVTAIKDLSYCFYITSVKLPDTVIRLENGAFFECRNLKTMDLGNGIQYIGQSSLAYCGSLERIYIPSSVTFIDTDVFWFDISLIEISVDKDNLYYKSIDGNLYSKDSKTLINYALGKNDTSFTIPDGVEKIGYIAFDPTYALKEIRIPLSVKIIDWGAFINCYDLTRFIYGGTINEWNTITKGSCWDDMVADSFGGNYTIYCTDGTIAKDGTVTYYTNSDNVSEGLKYELNPDGQSYSVVGIGTFTGKELVVPAFYNGKPVTDIGTGAFCHCDWILKITLPETIRNIGNTAFADCFELLSINIPRFISNLPPNVFGSCVRLKDIAYGGTVEEWNNLPKGEYWDALLGNLYGYCNINCKDGTIIYN